MSLSRIKPVVTVLVTIALTLATSPGLLAADREAVANAREVCDDDCVEVGRWSLSMAVGLGMRSNPLADGDNTPLVVLPELSYYGERFFLRNLEFGFNVFESRRHQLNLLVTPGFDQMHFNRWDIRNFTDGTRLSGPVGQQDNQSGQGGGGSGQGQSGQGGSGEDAKNDDGSEQGGLGSPESPPGTSGGGTDVDDRFTGSSSSSSSGSLAVGGGEDGRDQGGEPSDNGEDVELGSGEDGEVEGQNESPGEPAVGDGSEDGSSDGAGEDVTFDLDERRLALLAGVEYQYSLEHLTLHFQGLRDASQIHDGFEIKAAAIIPFQNGKNRWAFTLGANYQSRELIDYYYGVEQNEVNIVDWQYSPKAAGVSKMLRLDWQRWLSPNWSIRAMFQYNHLAPEISDSPIVSEDSVTAFFIGGVYHF